MNWKLILWVNKFLRTTAPHLYHVLRPVRNKMRHLYYKTGSATSNYDQAIKCIQTDTSDKSSILDDDIKDKWKFLTWQEELPEFDEYPLVSVIVPNYNHAAFLEERLETIFNQTYANYEVILLDDCSTDNSRDILLKYAGKYPNKTRVLFNDANEGKVFLQWNKGLGLARGKYIWIAESDDYSEPNFLEELIKCFQYSSVMLAFSRSDFMKDGTKTWSTEEYLSDIKTLKWDAPFTMTTSDAVKLGFGYKNIIPNVSSAVFRNIGKVPDEVLQICSSMDLSSDWIFYLAVSKGGCISYTNQTVNYYRVHDNSTSLKVQQSFQYYKEYEMVSQYIAANFKVDSDLFQKTLNYLIWHYKATQHVSDGNIVRQYYKVEKLIEVQAHRKPNIAMACYSLQAGGGETYPLYLANELHRQGCNVTLIDFNREGYEENCRKLLNTSVPLVRMRNAGELILNIKKLSIDVIHTHHGSVDEIAGKLLNSCGNPCKHIITLHGMYEAIADQDLRHLFDVVGKSCSCFFYIADKNLLPFKRYNLLGKIKYQKIDNGLPKIPVNAISRESLGIEKESFVLCLVSRGIAEKGWFEGIEAVKLANQKSTCPIHLIIVGDGKIRNELEKNSPNFIHFVGNQSNVRDYFATSDIGFLPTRFAGESYPLVVIEALMCGKPVLATDIAEVKHQLTDENGDLAGLLLNLHDGSLNIKEIADSILMLADNNALYRILQKRTVSSIKKFDIAEIVRKYLTAYEEVTELMPYVSLEE